MKNISIILNLFLIFTLHSCTKDEIVTPIEFQKQLLSGNGKYQNTQRIWQLDSAKIDGIQANLSVNQKLYKKIFTYDGGYSDSDMNIGKWEITTINKLKQTTFYQLTNRQDSLTYDISSINAARLELSIKLANGQTAIYSFKISN